MKKQIAVTIAGEAMTGKSSVAMILERQLKEYGVDVKNEDSAQDRASARTRDSIMKLASNAAVTIVTRVRPKPETDKMTDEGCLIRLNEARDFINSIALKDATDRVSQGSALGLIDQVSDEIEDRLAAAQALGGTSA